MSSQESQKPFSQPQDFLDESNALYELLKDLSDEEYEQATAFKDWTINDVIAHLHVWNIAADLSVQDPKGFQDFFKHIAPIIKAKGSLKDFERGYESRTGSTLLSAWRESYVEIAENFSKADPKARVEWVGPSMSVRSSITARLMETWAHGQELYDQLGQVRENTDRIMNIVMLGLNTFAYTYKVRGEAVPSEMPFVRLTAPSGKKWKLGNEDGDQSIEGLAEEFCQVVTQTRNIADTNLVVKGDVATDWMSKAQCFAGGAETPPKAGVRKIKK